MKIALQLYTVRKLIESEGLDTVLAKIKNIGFDYVETAGYAGLSAAEFKEHLEHAGLTCVSAHISYDNFKNIDAMVQDSADLGLTEVAIPNAPSFYYPKSAAGFTAAAEKMESLALALSERGIGLSYHNHSDEFCKYGSAYGEEYVFDTAKTLKVQIDCGHCRAAGEEPSEWIRRYADRIYSVHAKDINFDAEAKRYDTPIGDGLVDWDKVFSELVNTNCEVIIVEHESMPGDMYEHIERSYKFLSEKIAK